jgi:hypothetical protein
MTIIDKLNRLLGRGPVTQEELAARPDAQKLREEMRDDRASRNMTHWGVPGSGQAEDRHPN